MGSLNKLMLIGNVGRDPEVRTSRNGDPFATFTMATSYTYKNESGDRTDQTEWHRIVMWRRLAEQAEKYVKKGRKLYVEGRVQTRSYDDQSGTKRYVTEVVADRMEFLDTRESAQGSTEESADPMPTRPRATATVEQPARGSRPQAARAAAAPEVDFSGLDDLPYDFGDLRN